MLRTFDELVSLTRGRPRKTISVAVPESKEILQSLDRAVTQGIVDVVWAGNTDKLEAMRRELGLKFPVRKQVDARDEQSAAHAAVRMIADGEAQLLMKGNLHTSTILSALLHRDYGLRPEEAIISHVFILESRPCGRLLFVTDSAVNIAPDLRRKSQILQNAIDFVRKLGYDQPKAAILAAVEYVNEKMPATVEAAQLVGLAAQGKITGAVVAGPLALDDALSAWVSKEKKIEGPVQGDADILLVPDIEAGNILSKAQTFLAGGPLAGVAVGAKVPMVLNSRADSLDNRFFAIAAACCAA
jgi:phosphate butyryltransferase